MSNEEQVVNSDIYTYTYDDSINSTIPVKGEDFNVLANKAFEKFEYEFDDEGKLIKKTCLSYSGPGQYSESDRDEYKYNEKGYMTEDCYYYKNLLSKITRYNDKGEITEEINYIDGILYDRITYTMDSEGRRYTGCLYKDGEKYENYSTFVYNAEGLLIRYEENEDDGEYLHVYTYEYDSHGNMTKMNIYNKHIINSHSYSESNDTYEYVLTYDSNGNIIKKITYTTYGYGMAKQYESVYEYEEVPTMEKDK